VTIKRPTGSRTRVRGGKAPHERLLAMHGDTWQAWPTALRLAPQCVDVWRLDLPALLPVADRLAAVLTEDERRTADTYRRSEKQREYVLTRGALRQVLGRLLQAAPQSLALDYELHGKPRLSAGGAQFNVSHSHDVALIAVTERAPVGVDVERVADRRPSMALARRYFSPHEASKLAALPPSEQRLAFYRVWTRKEAFIKADGRGVSLGLDRFEVAVEPGDPARLIAFAGDDQAASRWTIADLPLDQGLEERYLGALAVRHEPGSATLAPWHDPRSDALAVRPEANTAAGWTVRLWQFQPDDA
jgi:4'-phosphopantetheinyl transferase